MYYVPLDHIRPNPWQPRQDTDPAHIKALAEDIYARRHANSTTKGLLQIPIARLVDDVSMPFPAQQVGGFMVKAQRNTPTYTLWTTGVYLQLAFGHSRIEAFRQLNKQYPHEHFNIVPLEIVIWGDQDMATAAWSENASRKDLNPVEEAHAIRQMMNDFGWTQDKTAEVLKINRSTVANKLRLLKLPEEVLTEIRKGTLSERQAVALLPMYDLPPETRETINENSAYSYLRPETIAKNAHKLTSDQLRDRVKESVAISTKSLGQTIFPLDIIIVGETPLRPVACLDCDRAISNKTEKRCVDIACFQAKESAWELRELTAASTATGLPIAPPHLTGRAYDTFWNAQSETVKHALDHQCASLHIDYSSHTSSNISPDFPNTRYICVFGPEGKCACRASLDAKEKKEKQKREAANKELLQSEILDPAIAQIVEAIRNGNIVVWRAIALSDSVRDNHRRQRLEKAKDVDQIAAVIALELLTRGIWYTLHENLERAPKDIAESLKKLGLHSPESESITT